MKKKVLFVITKSNWGGAQRYVYNLSMALHKDIHRSERDPALGGGFDVSVALGGTGTSRSTPGELAVRLESVNIPTFYISSFARNISLISDMWAVIELYQLFKKEKPDVVHLNSSKAGGVGALAARLAGVKHIIFTSHGLVWDEDRSAVVRILIKTFSWTTFLLCHQVIVISKDNFERVSTLPFCKNKIRLIYNGLPSLQFETRERARLSLALMVGLQEGGDSLWLGTTAELTRNKGLTYLIEAVKILIEKGQKFHLFIIGGGEQETELKNLIREKSLELYIHFVGFVPDAYHYNKAFDIFTLTSVKEGLPTVLLEAGQAGVSVVATNIPGTRDIIEDGTTGLLAIKKDVKDIAEKLTQLINDALLRKILAENLQKKVTEEFSIEQMVEETKKLYLG